MSTVAIINVEINFLGSEDPRKDQMKYAEIQEPSDLVLKLKLQWIFVLPKIYIVNKRLCDKWDF